jgi:hypothetical protein
LFNEINNDDIKKKGVGREKKNNNSEGLILHNVMKAKSLKTPKL